jgi:hypothetical protein
MESKKKTDVFYQGSDNNAIHQKQDEAYRKSLISNAPLVNMSSVNSLQHSISFDGAVMLNGKTRIGYACEIWAMFDDQSGFTYLSSETQSPCRISYSESAKNKTVAYSLRWINNRGETGPWSKPFLQTIE